MSFPCCPLPKKQILWLFPGDEFFLAEMLGTFADHQPFPNSLATRVSALKKKGSNFHSRALRIRGQICLTDCSSGTSGRILGCDFSNQCPGVHAGLQIILGAAALSIVEAGLQLLSGQEGEGLVEGPWNPLGQQAGNTSIPSIVHSCEGGSRGKLLSPSRAL